MLVFIIQDGVEKTRQYGQWDRSPDVAGYYICQFIKEKGVDRLKEILGHIKVMPDNPGEFHAKESLFQCRNEFFDIENFVEKYKDEHEDYSSLLWKSIKGAVEIFGYERCSEYFMKSRDTGYKILNVMDELENAKPENGIIPVYLTDCEPGRDFIINLDNNTFTIRIFDEIDRSWKLSELPNEEILATLEE